MALEGQIAPAPEGLVPDQLHAPKNSDPRLGPACADRRNVVFTKAAIATHPDQVKGPLGCHWCRQLVLELEKKARWDLPRMEADAARGRVQRRQVLAPIEAVPQYKDDWVKMAEDDGYRCHGFLTRYYDHFHVQLFAICADAPEHIEENIRMLKDALMAIDHRPVEESPK